MKALQKGVNRVRAEGESRFTFGKGSRPVILSMLGWLALDIMFGYLELGSSGEFRAFLQALREGNLNKAEEYHDMVVQWLIDHNLEKAAMDFDYRWANEWLPEATRQLDEAGRR